MFTALILDDEENSRASLKGKLEMYCPEVATIWQAASVKAALSAIAKHQPDVVFLDIQLAGESGFDVLEKLPQKTLEKIEVIFTTAHDEYALRAIKFSALDYLLKPIDVEELEGAINKLKEKNKAQPGIEKNLQVLLETFKQTAQEGPKKIAIATSEGVTVLRIAEIIRLESSSNYTYFFLKDGGKLLASKTLKDFDAILSDNGFERIHKSHLVNTEYIKKYLQADGGLVVMEDGTQIPVANRKKDDLLRLIRQL
jgi:two-component system LytT family response regulator